MWIARDLDGTLCLYTTEPWKRVSTDYRNGEFDCDDEFINIDSRLFPEVTFENSPQEIELKLANNTANGFAEDLLINCIPLEGEFSKFVDDNFEHLI